MLEEVKSSKSITYNTIYEEVIRTEYMKTYGTEGLECINHDMIKKQRGVFTYMIKKIGANILTGKSIMNVSLPINIFDGRTMLEMYK